MRPKRIRVTRGEFEAATKLGWIKSIENIPDAEQGPAPHEAPVKADSGSKQQETEAPRSNKPNPKTIIDTVADFVRRFVFFRDETYYGLIAAWVIATYLYEKFDSIGYLFAYSPEPRSGKTTLLEMLDLLVYQSTGIQVSLTEAVMFRTAEGHTHLLDEVDSWKNKADLKNVLNAGYKKGAIVTRYEKGKAGRKITQFSIFAPRALAGIGLSILDSATLDRTFTLPMVRQNKGEKRERCRKRIIGPEAEALKTEIENWVKEHEKDVAEIYQGKFPYLDFLNDRTVEIAEPLAAIVEVAYKGRLEANQPRERLIRAIASTRKEQQSASNDHVLLRHLLHLAETEDPLVGNATELAARCVNLEAPVDRNTVSRVLRKYEFEAKSVRRNGQDPRQRYSLSKAALQEVVARWAF
jgi:hypothetical protein